VLGDLHPVTDELKHPVYNECFVGGKQKKKEQTRSPHFAEKTEYH